MARMMTVQAERRKRNASLPLNIRYIVPTMYRPCQMLQLAMVEMVVKSQKDLGILAQKLWREIEPELGTNPVVVALSGPLGAGKTTLTRELARTAGIKTTVSSPTFVLHIPHKTELRVDSGKLTIGFEHIDAYRMEEFGELLQVGLVKMIENKSVIMIEWADKFRKEIERLSDEETKLIWVKMEYGKSENERKVEIK